MRTRVEEKRAAAMHNFTESRAGHCLGDERDHVRKNKKMQKNARKWKMTLMIFAAVEKKNEKGKRKGVHI